VSSDFAEVVWVGDQAIVWGYDSEGAFLKRELVGNEMAELVELQDKHNAAEQRLISRLLFQTEAA
jgi:hypothetical protein